MSWKTGSNRRKEDTFTKAESAGRRQRKEVGKEYRIRERERERERKRKRKGRESSYVPLTSTF